jgi:hypothetical protein
LCCFLCLCCAIGCVVGIYCVSIVCCNGVVVVNKIAEFCVFYIAWFCSRMRFICLFVILLSFVIHSFIMRFKSHKRYINTIYGHNEVSHIKTLNFGGYFMYYRLKNTKILSSAHTVYLCVLYGSQNTIQH